MNNAYINGYLQGYLEKRAGLPTKLLNMGYKVDAGLNAPHLFSPTAWNMTQSNVPGNIYHTTELMRLGSKALSGIANRAARWAPKLAPKLSNVASRLAPVSRWAGRVAGPAWVGAMGYDAAETLFRDPQTGQWNWNVANNMYNNKENVLNEVGTDGWRSVVRGGLKGFTNPMKTLAVAGGTAVDTAKALWNSQPNTDRPITQEELAAALERRRKKLSQT